MKTYVERLCEEYPAMDIQLCFTAKRGYHLRIPRKKLSNDLSDVRA